MRLRRIFYLLNCYLIRRAHYFCPWYKSSRGEIGVIKRRCRDCGITETKTVTYDAWNSVNRENICL